MINPPDHMSVDEARELLGEKYRKLSDEEVEKIVWDLEIIASATVKAIMSGQLELPSE